MRLRGVTLLETLVSLALVAILFALLIPLLTLGGETLSSADRASKAAERVALRNDLRRAFQTIMPGGSGFFDFRGNSQSLILYSYEPILAVPDAAAQRVSVDISDGNAVIYRTALAADQSVLSEDQRVYELDADMEISFLPPCLNVPEWQTTWAGQPPVSIRLLAQGETFWPDFLARRPLMASDGC